MPLSEKTIQLFQSYLEFIEPKASAYRERLMREVPPEQLSQYLPLIYTTNRPDEPISQITTVHKGKLSWKSQMIGCCLPFPSAERNWYEEVAEKQREKVFSAFINEIPISDEDTQKFNLSEQLKNFAYRCLDKSTQNYLAIVLLQGTDQKNQAFQNVINQLNTRLDQEKCIRYSGCYLYNFLPDPLVESVDISPDIKIRMTTFGDIEREVSLGQNSEDRFLPPEYILTFQLKKIPSYQNILDYGYGGNLSDEIEKAVTALRLNQPNYVGYSRIKTWTEGLPLSFGWITTHYPDRPIRDISSNWIGDSPQKYVLKVDQVDEIRTIFQKLNNDTVQSRLKIALTKFNDSYRWSDGREKIIDLVIAMENIFGEETVGQSTEVGYRLRMRAARFLGDNLQEREDLKQFFSNLYALRSMIVHGDSKDVDKLIKKNFKRSLSEIITETEYYLRESLRKIIDDPSRIGQDYFNKLLLGGFE